MKRICATVLLVVLLVLPSTAQAAIVTQPFASFGGGLVVVNFDHNTGSGNVLRFRVINNSTEAAWLGVYDCPDGVCSEVGSVTVGGGVTFEQNVPGVSVAWECQPIDPDPQWGCEWGLSMGDYQFRSRWPAE